MANVTKIKAKDAPDEKQKPKKVKKANRVKEVRKSQAKSTKKKPFILFRPFVALGSYLYASWKELRLVRWPNRKTTWKMVLAVFLYTLIFVGFLVALDILFDLLFTKLLA